MSYFKDFDAWLAAVLLGGEEGETSEQWLARVTKDIKAKVLESYRNGQEAGLKPKPEVGNKPKAEVAGAKWPPHIHGS